MFDVKTITEMEDIPADLVLNWDQTGIHYVPVSSYTMEKGGSKRVEIAGIENKRQITACCLSATMSGPFSPVQLIYQGKTAKMSSFSTVSIRLGYNFCGQSLVE